ncbi:MAG: hypothetical protein ABSG43_16355 [Solirubrobacteraceae bacterium]
MKRQRDIALAALAITLIVIVMNATSGGGTGAVPITPAMLHKADQLAEATGSDYDYACQLYGAPRQILCTGQTGSEVEYLVSPSGQLQQEPSQ